MDIGIKQRIVGAVVLVSIAIILLPVLLDGDAHLYQTRHELPLPPEPPAMKAVLDLERSPARIEIQKRLAEQAENTDKTADAEDTPTEFLQDVAPKRTISPHPPLQSWVVQVGSFSSEDNANKLKKKLQNKGMPVFVQVKDVEGKQVYRVRIGPEIDRARAEKLRLSLSRDIRTGSKVISYP